MKIGILGMGKMGEAIALGLRRSDPQQRVEGSTRSADSAREASKHLKIHCDTDNARVAASSEVLLLCVKPHQAERVVREIAPVLTAKHLLISICAAITTEQ